MDKIYSYSDQGKGIFKKCFKKSLATLMILALFIGSAYAQTRKVTGIVKDGKGETLPGVSVKLKGTANGTVTDAKGTYMISVPDNNATLVFPISVLLPRKKQQAVRRL